MTDAKRADEHQAHVITEVLQIKKQIKDLEDRSLSLLQELPQGQALISKVDGEYRTVAVGKPEGAWFRFRELDLLRNAKTTDKDKKYYGLF